MIRLVRWRRRQRTQQPGHLQPYRAVQLLVGDAVVARNQQRHPEQPGPGLVVRQKVRVLPAELPMHGNQIVGGTFGRWRVDSAPTSGTRRSLNCTLIERIPVVVVKVVVEGPAVPGPCAVAIIHNITIATGGGVLIVHVPAAVLDYGHVVVVVVVQQLLVGAGRGWHRRLLPVPFGGQTGVLSSGRFAKDECAVRAGTDFGNVL